MNYVEFRKSISDRIVEKTEWRDLATFVPNKKLPIYNWAYYKEGFSRDLVLHLLEMFGLQKGTVLDPFCGVGTTLLACREKGVDSIGMDVLPFPVFASHVKSRNYSTDGLKVAAKELLGKRFERTGGDFPPLMRRAFSKYALEDISFFRARLEKTADEDARNFFLLALINAAIKVSYAWKDGASIKIRKAPRPPLRFMLKRTIHRMIKDVENRQSTGALCTVEQCDARMMRLQDGSVDAVITSPPYLNQIDYTKVYEIENWFISGIYQKPALRSYIGLEEEIEFLPELQLPPSARAYFRDMHLALEGMYRVCKSGAKLAIVVGNAYFQKTYGLLNIQKAKLSENFPGRIVDSDLILCQLAESIGFSIEKMLVLNTRFALEERTKKKGVLRESAIIMHK